MNDHLGPIFANSPLKFLRFCYLYSAVDGIAGFPYINRMAKKLTIEEFLETAEMRNEYIRYKDIVAYVRKSLRLIDGERKRCLDRANTKNVRRQNNMESMAKFYRTGLYREFDDLMKRLAVEYGYDGVYVESVLNDFLPDVLVRYGYRLVPDHDPPCYFWDAKQ